MDREPPATLDALGPKLRISAADARAGAGERLGAPYAKSNFVRHVPIGERPNSIVCQTPRVKFEPGRYLLRCNLTVVGGTDGDQAGLIIAGDGNEGAVKIMPIVVDSSKFTKYLSPQILEFTVPPGEPMELTCRVETSGRAAMDVDDLEVFGPLLDDRFK